MFISYYDESGDDGYPQYSSVLFILTCVYFHHNKWKDIYNALKQFRQTIKKQYNFPLKMEMHASPFIFNKKPYKELRYTNQIRVEILDKFVTNISSLNLLGVKVINVIIDKSKIATPSYQVLDKAFTYSIQRIENDLKKNQSRGPFIIITDPGRLGKMRQIARKIQRYNPVPSKFGPSPYRNEIECLIEDPISKESSESYFIQMADLISYIINLYKKSSMPTTGLPNRLPTQIDKNKIESWMKVIKPCLNLDASGADPYGIVCYPK